MGWMGGREAAGYGMHSMTAPRLASLTTKLSPPSLRDYFFFRLPTAFYRVANSRTGMQDRLRTFSHRAILDGLQYQPPSFQR